MDMQDHTDSAIQKVRGIQNPMIENKLGRVLRVGDLACYLGLDEKTVRLYYRELGGVRLGRRILFFEKEVINAVQKRSKMGSPSESQWEEEGEDLPEQERGNSLGKRKPIKSRRDMVGEDKHGVLV